MEKRYYQRTNIDISSSFYIEGAEVGRREFVGFIRDISENGVKIGVPDEKYWSVVDELQIGSAVYFQTIDRYTHLGESKTELVQGECFVVRKFEQDGEKMLGCEIKRLEDDLEEYISNKKMDVFVNTGCRVVF